jgi:copper chaperone CopZ
MKKYQYKTNIMCDSCIAKVSPVLNEIAGENKWNVDLKNPKRILTVSSDSDNENKIVTALQNIGYKAEEIK